MKRLTVLLIAFAAFSVVAAEPRFDDPSRQARYEDLINELRCLVCQNQTIADSNADLALDLREKVAEQIAAGRSDEQIVAYLTARYGDFVLYRPPVQPNTWLLWSGPFLLLALGGIVVAVTVRRRARFEDADDDSTREENEQ